MGEPAAGPKGEGERASPAPRVDGTSTPNRTHRPSSLNENDSTPRSEQPSVPEALSATLLTHAHPLEPEPSYFSPQPLRLYSSSIPRSPATGSDPSPAPSTSTSGASLNTAAYVRGEERSSNRPIQPARPLIQRDISSASTASNATVRANSVDPTHTYGISPRRDGPVYPNQSYAALHLQQHPTAHIPPIVRSRTTHPHPAHSTANSLSSLGGMFGISDDHYRDIVESGPRTVGNSPISSPGLFDPINRRSQSLDQPDDGLYSSPWLHHTHRQPPKETHVADVQADPATGRKIVNQYEIIDELGRGVHGKVKLGKELGSGRYVAIKIVDRYSKRRRLGKNTSHEDKIKREIAILKKARHPNIVSLLEVIDDPAKKKVYIVLEHVELGEVKWRTEGAKEICLVEWRRFKRESQGIFDNEKAVVEDERIIRLAHQKLATQQRTLAKEAQQRYEKLTSDQPWSLEFGMESEGEYSDAARSSEASHHDHDRISSRVQFRDRHPTANQHETNMETAFRSSTPEMKSRSSGPNPTTESGELIHDASGTELDRGRFASLTDIDSPLPTELIDEDIPEHFQWVPLMTFRNAWEAFKDTVLGIEYLHYQNVIHRDIKPANLLVTKEHRIKISDFGVSYLGRSKTDDSAGDHSESDNQEVDEAIELAKTVGTPAFYAPELCRTETDEDTPNIDGAIDVWALGVTLYCLIYGRVPFHDTNTFTLMRVISDQEPHISRYRLKPVAGRSNSRPSSHGRNSQAAFNSKRARHDLEYEEVDENLRDLLRRLLIKDARYRITIPEIKRHPWVLSGISNYDAWVEETDPSRSYDGRRIEISRDDVEKAVVPIGLVERIRKKAGDFFSKPFTRTSGSRRRAQSSATNQEGPPPISTNSSSSTISQDGRRGSLAPGAILEILGRSREAEHPLSHSVTASPEAKDHCGFFDTPNSRTASPAQSADGSRPLLSDRAVSSVHTIRQSDLLPGGAYSPGLPPALPGTPTALDSPGGSQLGGLFGGLPRRVVNSMRSRDKLRPPREHFRAKSIDRLIGGEDDAHGAPSLAISNTNASGHMDQPDALKDLSPIARGSSPSFSETYSFGAFDANSRQSSRSSLSSRLHRNWAAGNDLEGVPPLPLSPDLRPQYSQPPRAVMPPAQDFNAARRPSHPVLLVHKKSDHRITRSKDEHVQHNMAEPSWYHNNRPTSATYPRPPSSLSQAARPSSPCGDSRFRHQKVEDYLNGSNHSSENSPVGEQERGFAFSSSEEQFTPMSHSASNPSIPSVASAGSSAPDECPPLAHFGGIVTTASADSISGNQFEAPADDPAGYDGDHPHDSEGDDESDDDALFFGKKPRASKAQQNQSKPGVEATRPITDADLTIRRRSARSGSNGTVKKIPPPEELSGQQNQTLGASR